MRFVRSLRKGTWQSPARWVATLAYIRRFDQPNGSVVVPLVTNRLLRFGEVWADTRSTDYELSGL